MTFEKEGKNWIPSRTPGVPGGRAPGMPPPLPGPDPVPATTTTKKIWEVPMKKITPVMKT